MCPNVQIVLFKIAKILKQHECPSIDEWINKEWVYIHRDTTKPYKRNTILPFAATWMDLEGIMLSEINQTEKNKYRMISLLCGI